MNAFNHNRHRKRRTAAAAVFSLVGALASATPRIAHAQMPDDALAKGFAAPPTSARPHTWWHWMNGNVTREGITADLEAMKRLGLGGAQIFNVEEGIPPGPIHFGSKDWVDMTRFAVQEADRLGLELCIHNCAGWSSSGGPWVKPEQAMQMVVTADRKVSGPVKYTDTLPQPTVHNGFYRDIAVLAFPTPAKDAGPDAIPNFKAKAGYTRGDNIAPAGGDAKLDAFQSAIRKDTIVDLTGRFTADGHLNWDVPPGDWTILRIGYTPTGVTNHPAQPEGRGLECDKLSAEAVDAHFAGMVQKLLDNLPPTERGKKSALNNVLVDSYEVGGQNWTPRFREEFRKRRGYDILPFLPVFAGRVVESPVVTERFLWDLRHTIVDLFDENYYGRFARLCHDRGLLFSTEPYGNGPFDDLTAGGAADIPMGEFWIGGGELPSCKLAASSAHTYARTVVGAESFTAAPSRGKWTNDPASLKALGDKAYTLGINRFIFHRYAMQPWLNHAPGMTMGQWGTHFERTNTWWDTGGASDWMRYLTRCQYLLQSGRFDADIACFCGENGPVGLLHPDIPDGYDYDGVSLDRLRAMRVDNGDLVLPGGMRYRVLTLPPGETMTPATLKVIRDLVRSGATVIGPRPQRSPSLQDFPRCDNEVEKIAADLWGNCDGKTVTSHKYGKGQILWGVDLALALSQRQTPPDVTVDGGSLAKSRLAVIHRTMDNRDIYFVSNQQNAGRQVTCTFRHSGSCVPELWDPETGRITPVPAYTVTPAGITIPLRLEATGSVFVVFHAIETFAAIAHFTDATVSSGEASPGAPAHTLVIKKAVYEAADGAGSADVTAKVAAQVQPDASLSIEATNDNFGDPTYNHVKQLRVSYEWDGKPAEVVVGENERLEIPNGGGTGAPLPPSYTLTGAGLLGESATLLAFRPGAYTLTSVTSAGSSVKRTLTITDPLTPVEITGGWDIAFPPNLGAPATTHLDALASWTENSDPGVRYFSGTATYSRDIDIPANLLGPGRAVFLDLGQVKNLAQVRLNGIEVGSLWKPPFRLEITNTAHPGVNHLEVRVTNLWPNRLIGDEQLPPDVEWSGIHLKAWPQWLLDGKTSPTGRITFTTWHHYTKDSALLPSGILGPVRLLPAIRQAVTAQAR